MMLSKRIIPIFIPHKGCPHDCVFCNQKRISGSLLPATAGDVIKTIENALAAGGGVYQVAFYGGSFTAIPAQEQEELLAAVRPYIRQGKVSGIRLSTRPDCIDAEILSRLKEYHVDVIELGSQSMIDDVLDKSGRGHTAEDTVAASRLIKEWGFKLVLQMMTGLPGSSRALDIETARKIAGLEPDAVRIYPTVIVKDTALFDMWQSGDYKEHSVSDAAEICAEIMDIFEDAGIPVIRLGLNPTDDLSGGDAAAGAYHPALGEIVRSRRYLNRAKKLLEGVAKNSSVILGVHPACISQMTGQHRANITELCRIFGLKNLKVSKAEVKPGEVVIVSVANEN